MAGDVLAVDVDVGSKILLVDTFIVSSQTKHTYNRNIKYKHKNNPKIENISKS